MKIPQHWQDALLDLQQKDPSAIIAGGAIRDLYCGREVKDVDFFVNHETAACFTGKLGEPTTKDYKGMQYILGVVDYPLEQPPFSIIYHENPGTMKLLESFDFGICQIGWNGKEIIKTPAFDWDFKYGVITLRKGDRFLRAIERFNRINKKYYWPLAIGEGVQINTVLEHRT